MEKPFRATEKQNVKKKEKMGFTLTRRQYDKVLDAAKKIPDEEVSTKVKLDSQEIEAALLGDKLYVATFKDDAKMWELVSHRNLKDVLIEPVPSSGRVKPGRPQTPNTFNLQPPKMPVFSYLDDYPPKPFFSSPAIFPCDTGWRAGTEKFLSEKVVDWHISQAFSLLLLDDPPEQLAYANANLRASADLRHIDAFASPQQSMSLSDEPFSTAASSGRFSARSVSISPVQGHPVTFDPHQLPAQLQPTTTATSESIKKSVNEKRALRYNRPVDPSTGNDVPAGTPNAVPRRYFLDHRKVFDPITRQQVSSGTKGAVTSYDLKMRQRVDAKDGTLPNDKTKKTITLGAYLRRMRQERVKKRVRQNSTAFSSGDKKPLE